MSLRRLWLWAALPAAVLAGCAAEIPGRPTHTVEAVGKVIDSLTAEAIRRSGADGYRGLPVVVESVSGAARPVELIVAEFLRTRLHERGIAVSKACAARCLEITLQEFATSEPDVSGLSPGQILTVATGSIPVLGGVTRSLGEREREKKRAAARTTGLLVTFAARDGDKFTARSHVVAIISTSSGEVALEQK